jgi:ATP-binding cassette subfamily A (ABC1) protein 3
MLYEIIFLAWQSIVYIGLAIYIDTLLTNQKLSNLSFKRRTQSQTSNSAVDEDEDVIAETQRILSGEANDDAILLSDLKKEYPNGKLAVDGLSFGIPAGQCFGLLGINGAGKTTTMAMLTAEFPPTGGDATLSGYSITTQPEETRRRCGYCPQFDAHFVNMTGRYVDQMFPLVEP